jgi:hypothetical protein
MLANSKWPITGDHWKYNNNNNNNNNKGKAIPVTGRGGP